MKDLDDAKTELASVLKSVRNGADVKQALAEIAAIKAFADVHVSQIKNDPKEEAKREFARGAARKAAEAIDLDKAKEILSSRRFLALEDAMGLIPDDVVIAKGKEVVEMASKAEIAIKGYKEFGA